LLGEWRARREAPSYKFPPTITPGTDIDTTGHDVVQATHTPDIAFRREEDALPGTIIEVTYSQAQRDLIRLACTYLVLSNATVQVVLGFDLKSRPTLRATFSVWRNKDEGDVLSMVTTDYDYVRDCHRLVHSLLTHSRSFVTPTAVLQVTNHYVFDSKTL
jgi:hypothetical protein